MGNRSVVVDPEERCDYQGVTQLGFFVVMEYSDGGDGC